MNATTLLVVRALANTATAVYAAPKAINPMNEPIAAPQSRLPTGEPNACTLHK